MNMSDRVLMQGRVFIRSSLPFRNIAAKHYIFHERLPGVVLQVMLAFLDFVVH
jgi:hypothetical protein